MISCTVKGHLCSPLPRKYRLGEKKTYAFCDPNKITVSKWGERPGDSMQGPWLVVLLHLVLQIDGVERELQILVEARSHHRQAAAAVGGGR